MTVIQRYSKKESFNRLYRLYKVGATPPSDAPDSLPGQVYSEDTAFSRFVELIAGSLPGETAQLPPNVIVNPANVEAMNEHGEIYTSTGTVTMSLAASTWTKITGSFHVNGLSSSNIVPDYDDDRITVNATGTYLVDYGLSISGQLNATFEFAAYVDGVRQENTKAIQRVDDASDFENVGASGFFTVTGSATDVEVYVQCITTGTSSFKMDAGQINIRRIPA